VLGPVPVRHILLRPAAKARGGVLATNNIYRDSSYVRTLAGRYSS
jgi:hypothetical protein